MVTLVLRVIRCARVVRKALEDRNDFAAPAEHFSLYVRGFAGDERAESEERPGERANALRDVVDCRGGICLRQPIPGREEMAAKGVHPAFGSFSFLLLRCNGHWSM